MTRVSVTPEKYKPVAAGGKNLTLSTFGLETQQGAEGLEPPAYGFGALATRARPRVVDNRRHLRFVRTPCDSVPA
jgi:hypothetical protein